MKSVILKQVRRRRRKLRVRKHVVGTPQRPRLTVHRSLKHIAAQVVDDVAGRTVAAVSSTGLHLAKGGNSAAAKEVGKALAEKAKAAGVQQVVFDRNAYKYHGRVKALADAARAGGLKF